MSIEHEEFLSNLQPYNVGLQHIRLGSPFDGGYVVPLKAVVTSDVFYTFGVGGDISFEEDVNAFTNKEFCFFDHTIPNIPFSRPNYKFFKHGLGDDNNCRPYEYYINRLNHAASKIFLKVDIEGGEFEGTIEKIPEALFNNVVCLVLEIHDVDNLKNVLKFNEISKYLGTWFVLTHTHFNNFGKIFNIFDHKISNAVELTFVNSKYIECAPTLPCYNYPIYKLDGPNNRNLPDIPLSFIKQSKV